MAETDAGAGVRFSTRGALVAIAPMLLLLAAIVFDFPICPARIFVGIPCPGCGLTRASLAMMSGDFVTMLRVHPLAPIFLPLFAYGMIRAGLSAAGLLPKSWKDNAGRKVPSWVWASLAVALLGLYGIRLAGFLGGTPDPVDLTSGLIYRGAAAILSLLFPS